MLSGRARHARLGLALVLAAATLAGCGRGRSDLDCAAYRALGTGSNPVADQRTVLEAHIDTDVRDPGLEIALAHLAATYWCNQRDADGQRVHEHDAVGDYLDNWK